MHHSAENGKFAFHKFLLAMDTDYSTFTTDRGHYGQLIYNINCLFFKIQPYVPVILVRTAQRVMILETVTTVHVQLNTMEPTVN